MAVYKLLHGLLAALECQVLGYHRISSGYSEKWDLKLKSLWPLSAFFLNLVSYTLFHHLFSLSTSHLAQEKLPEEERFYFPGFFALWNCSRKKKRGKDPIMCLQDDNLKLMCLPWLNEKKIYYFSLEGWREMCSGYDWPSQSCAHMKLTLFFSTCSYAFWFWSSNVLEHGFQWNHGFHFVLINLVQ